MRRIVRLVPGQCWHTCRSSTGGSPVGISLAPPVAKEPVPLLSSFRISPNMSAQGTAPEALGHYQRGRFGIIWPGFDFDHKYP